VKYLAYANQGKKNSAVGYYKSRSVCC